MNKLWKIIINIEAVILIMPVSLFYIWGFMLSFFPIANSTGPFEPNLLILPGILLIPGFGLLAIWFLATRYEQYAKNKIPISVLLGLSMGVVTIVYITVKTGLGLLKQPVLFYAYGGGPLITLCTIFFVIHHLRKSNAPNKAPLSLNVILIKSYI